MEFPESVFFPPSPGSARSTQLASAPKSEPVGAKGDRLQADAVRLTANGRDFKNAVDQLPMVPEIREDRIARLKLQLEEGSYRIQTDRIASSMMTEALENNEAMKSA